MFLKMISFGLNALAQTAETATTVATATGTAAEPPAWMQFVPMIAIGVVFYFFMIRPQAKRHKEQQNFLGSLKVGDQVVTQSGLLGKITGLNDQVANLEISNGVTVKFLRSQITMLQAALQKNETTKS
jgi:preprotein translocase subunit YajC